MRFFHVGTGQVKVGKGRAGVASQSAALEGRAQRLQMRGGNDILRQIQCEKSCSKRSEELTEIHVAALFENGEDCWK